MLHLAMLGSLCLSLLLSGTAGAVEPTACLPAIFVVHGTPLVPDGPAESDLVIIRDGTVAIASGCAAARARIVRTPWGIRLRARWDACDGLGDVKLWARVSRDCRRLNGFFTAASPPYKRFFRAAACNDPASCLQHCNSNDECGANQYCARDSATCDAVGLCRRRPDACPENYDPVCGCGSITYGNACEAAAAGVNVQRSGTCEVACDIANPCAEGQFCEMPVGICASGLDAGVCVDVSNACPTVYDPVCGCDGKTYGNHCERRAARVQKSSDGACAECATACDCESKPFQQECPLLCPSCGSYWTCKAGQCVEQCGPLPGACDQR